MTGSKEKMCAKTGKGGETGHEFKSLGLCWVRWKARLSLGVANGRWHMISGEIQRVILQAAVQLTTRSIN